MRVITHIADYLCENKIIATEEKEIVRYGLDALTETLLGLLVTVLVGSVFVNALSGLMLWLLVFPLRKYAGGY